MGALVFAAIMHMQEKRLVVALSENVANFLQKHKASMHLLVDTIRGLAYEVSWRIIFHKLLCLTEIRGGSVGTCRLSAMMLSSPTTAASITGSSH